MNTPEPEDLRRIERATFRAIARRKLPIARAALAAAIARKSEPEET